MRCIISIAVRNNLPGLTLTVNSILNRINHRNADFFFIDFVDGNSTDGSTGYIKKLIATIGCNRARLIVADPKGVYNAMNIGLLARDSEDWNWHINSGDLLIADLNYIKSIIIENNNSYDLIVGRCALFFSEDPKFLFSKNKNNELAHQACIYRTRLHAVYGFYNEALKACADIEFLKNIDIKRIVRADSIFAATHVSPRNLSRRPDSIRGDMRIIDTTNKLSATKRGGLYIRIFILEAERIIGISVSVIIKIFFLALIGRAKLIRLE